MSEVTQEAEAQWEVEMILLWGDGRKREEKSRGGSQEEGGNWGGQGGRRLRD